MELSGLESADIIETISPVRWSCIGRDLRIHHIPIDVREYLFGDHTLHTATESAVSEARVAQSLAEGVQRLFILLFANQW
jgi:hypothetical protein